MQGIFIVDRNLFARADIAQREKEHVAVKRPHVGVRSARVIDVVRAVAAPAAVQTPAAIDIADTQDATITGPFSRFEICYSLAGVLGDLFAATEMNSRETAFAVNWRFTN